jgi:hypothetical protein
MAQIDLRYYLLIGKSCTLALPNLYTRDGSIQPIEVSWTFWTKAPQASIMGVVDKTPLLKFPQHSYKHILYIPPNPCHLISTSFTHLGLQPTIKYMAILLQAFMVFSSKEFGYNLDQ